MPFHSSLAIANEFLHRARDEGRVLTHMHLQKLVYLAHGWGLAVTGRPIIEDRFEAWDYGPVVRKLFDALRAYGAAPIEHLISEDDANPGIQDYPGGTRQLTRFAAADLTDQERAVIDRVWDEYKNFEAFQLSALTHEPNGPWDRTFGNGGGKSRAIDDNLIWDYFATLAARHG